MKRILVIEDNPVNSRIMETVITKKRPDIEIISVDNGSEAVFFYLTQPFDLVFLDIMMAGINGYQFLSIVEENIKAGHIPFSANIVVQTAITSYAELKALAAKEIVQDVLRKPLTVLTIEECLALYC